MSSYGWMSLAACAGMDPDLWFPDRCDGAALETAVAVCAGCPVRGRCLDYALNETLSYGIFAGTTPGERQLLRAQRGIRARRGPRWLAPHGTSAACRRHYRDGERPCQPCADAEQRRHAPYSAARTAASSAAAPASSR